MKNVNVLALDLGTHTGYAVRLRSGVVFSGDAKFNVKKGKLTAERWSSFRTWLTYMINTWNINVVVYEEVRRHTATQAAHVYGGFKALLEMTCAHHDVEYFGLEVKTIKKHATGHGNANKEEMIEAAARYLKQFGSQDLQIKSDDQADALHILHLVLTRGDV